MIHMTLEERVEALEKELQKMKDIEAIKELKGKYFRCLDGKMWDELETTLSPNIVTSYPTVNWYSIARRKLPIT